MAQINISEIRRLERFMEYIDEIRRRTEDKLELNVIYNTILQIEEEIIELKSIKESGINEIY